MTPDYRRIAELEYELGFTDERPPWMLPPEEQATLGPTAAQLAQAEIIRCIEASAR